MLKFGLLMANHIKVIALLIVVINDESFVNANLSE